jgi:BASS family bile acid:Na+ symporter
MTLAERRPALARRWLKPLRRFGLAVFAAFLVLAVAANGGLFWQVLAGLFAIVLVHNAGALLCGFTFGTLFRLAEAERRAVTFETGIHNTALGLTLVFTYLPGQSAMMLVLAWWGVWHLVTGGLLAWFWSKRPALSVHD